MTWADRRYELNDAARFTAKPGAATKALIGVCVGVWLLQIVAGPAGRARMEYYLALSPHLVVKRLFLWQPLTYMFLHSTGGLFHILFNMLCLFFIGPSVEAVLGPKRFVRLFVVGGLIGGIAHCFFMPSNPVVGASAGVMALLVVFAALYPNAQFLFMFIVPMKAKHLVLLLIGIDLYRGYHGGSGIAAFAHLGGALYGYLFLRFGSMSESMAARWTEARRRKHELRLQRQREQVDRLLDKINATGMESLTRKERAFLLEASRSYQRERRG